MWKLKSCRGKGRKGTQRKNKVKRYKEETEEKNDGELAYVADFGG